MGYRGKVADHFAGTSERLRELTLQYRAIYNHLAEGAGELCPESFEKLEGGLGLDALPEETLQALSERTENQWDLQQTAVVNDLVTDRPLEAGHLVKVAVSRPYRPDQTALNTPR